MFEEDGAAVVAAGHAAVAAGTPVREGGAAGFSGAAVGARLLLETLVLPVPGPGPTFGIHRENLSHRWFA